MFDVHQFLFRFDYPLFRPAAALNLKPCMKLREIRCHFQEKYHRRARRARGARGARGDRRDYLFFFLSVLCELRGELLVFFSIRPAVFLPAAGLTPDT